MGKAIGSDLLIKNSAKQINTVIFKEVKEERRVLSVSEAEIFCYGEKAFYYDLYTAAIVQV